MLRPGVSATLTTGEFVRVGHTYLRLVCCMAMPGLLVISVGCRRVEPLTPPTAEELAYSTRYMLLTLPDRTEPIAFRHFHGLDDTILLKLRMPVDDVERLILNSPFKDVLLSTSEKPITGSSSLKWWKADSVKNYRAGMVELPDAKRLYIVIDFDDGEFVTVYLHYQET